MQSRMKSLDVVMTRVITGTSCWTVLFFLHCWLTSACRLGCGRADTLVYRDLQTSAALVDLLQQSLDSTWVATWLSLTTELLCAHASSFSCFVSSVVPVRSISDDIFSHIYIHVYSITLMSSLTYKFYTCTYAHVHTFTHKHTYKGVEDNWVFTQ